MFPSFNVPVIKVDFVHSRLPIIQGGTITFLVSINAILSLPKWKCPDAQGKYANYVHYYIPL